MTHTHTKTQTYTEAILDEINAERRHQVLDHGYGADHDDEHGSARLANLAVDRLEGVEDPDRVIVLGERRDLLEAAAILVAAIESWDRTDRGTSVRRGESERCDGPGTFWNGLPTRARRGTAMVADAPEFLLYWARGIVGDRIEVVEVVLEGVNAGGGITYLDDRLGDGWRKVTDGRGSPRFGHRTVHIVEDSFEAAS